MDATYASAFVLGGILISWMYVSHFIKTRQVIWPHNRVRMPNGCTFFGRYGHCDVWRDEQRGVWLLVHPGRHVEQMHSLDRLLATAGLSA